MTRLRLWLTPATVVVALALVAVTAGLSLRGVNTIRGWFAEPTPAASPQAMYTVPGAIRLPAGQYVDQGQSCQGTAITPDAQVVVTDRSGATVAYAPLGAGVLTGGACELPFSLTMPTGKGEYGLDFPVYGLMPYTEQEVADLLTLTIG
ncbi:hypothetical protein OG992_18650 [Micromonospora sp. NBC_00362]|uniref:hypothetical protein n=1 Tax=Micromonospora sp. NBC_00362 TaxID=2975975 RepID=UPI0022554E64|nr:hypothetical protein [Micromonospora sp. NBC_00362]MCX5119209.1 hypothetical protein [Micromonospora sp. NBC_00362]